MFDLVDPFIGTAATDLPQPHGIAASWWWPKPQVGNTHPGATYPFGMVSACAYSGAYPPGYGIYELGTEGLPVPMTDRMRVSGFTHFQQSGTGAIRKYYNYFRVTPMLSTLDDLGTAWQVRDEYAEPGYYRAELETGIVCEITVGPKSAVHRYTFPESRDARLVVDFSTGGLAIPYGETVPLRAHLEFLRQGSARGEVVMEGAPLAVHLECDATEFRQVLWYDRRIMPGGSRLDFADIRPTTLRPFGLMWAGPSVAGQTVELRMGFSLRGTEQAKANLAADTGNLVGGFHARRQQTQDVWRDHLSQITVSTPDRDQGTVMATALYHSLMKPCFAKDESPFWPTNGPFVYDLCTMWDIYKTQLPLMTLLRPKRAVDLANALLKICEEEGNFPIGYRMARGADRFSRQGSALAHTLFADLCQLRMPGVDWDRAVVHMHADLRRTYGEEYLRDGITHPISHVLDLAFGYWCAAVVADAIDDQALVDDLAPWADGWPAAFNPETGLMAKSTFYEGGPWNYSFRLLHDMAARIKVAGGEDRFVELLDRFFGYGAPAVVQPGLRPGRDELERGYELGRFEGMNNEPDMEAPWAYHYAGRPDRTAEVVHAAVHQMFGTGPGGLAGNDDSGAISSWYVWASLGLFPVAGQNVVLLHPPAFEEAEIRTAESEIFIRTSGFRAPSRDTAPQYIQSVRLDGVEVPQTWLTMSDLHRGGELHITLSDTPSDWGSSLRPPSRPSVGATALATGVTK